MVNTMKNTNTIFFTPPIHTRFIAIMILLMLPMLSFAKSLTVSADRQTIEMGDIITLIIQADFQTRGSQLDLEHLEDQFEILGRQQSNQISIINGQFSSNTQWRITLLAKQEGELIVPPLRIEGIESKPYKIEVLPAQKKSTKARGNYFLETGLSKQKVYVQEEVLYSLKFYFLGAFQGNIRPPTFENSLTVTLKEQDVYGKQVNGKHYTVYEWLYAVYPQQSGSLTIKGPIFSGIHQYLNRQKGVQEVAENQTLTVLPEPIQLKKNPNDPWLPAKSLTLSETWQSLPSTLRVGDSLTRTLLLESQGLRASQLPTLSTENRQGFKVYNDQPVTEETLTDKGVYSQLQQTQTLILTQAGQITLPEQRINWFNTQTNTMETETLNARTLTVLPALNATPSHSNTMTVNPTSNEQTTPSRYSENAMTEKVSRETLFIWPLITSLLGFAWFITLILWRRQTKKLKAKLQHLNAQNSLEAQLPLVQKNQTITLCNSNEMPTPSIFYSQLKTQLKERYSINAFNELENSDLKQAIYQLEAHLFSNAELAEDTLKIICEGIKKLTDQFSSPPSQIKSKLTSLYADS